MKKPAHTVWRLREALRLVAIAFVLFTGFAALFVI